MPPLDGDVAMSTKNTKKNHGCERGQALVEFALILPFLLLLLFGITEFGRALYQKNMTINAAREGTRFAAVQSSWTPQDIQNIKDRASSVITLNVLTHVDVPPKPASGAPVTITVTTKFKTVVPNLVIPLKNYTSITASATM